MDDTLISAYRDLLPLGAVVTTVGGAWLTIRKISKDADKSKREQAAEILHSAKEEDALIKTKLEAEIKSLKSELKHLEESVSKDMDHLKDTYTGEIKNLGEKIDDLRTELNNRHGQLVQLLSEMIKKK